MTSLGGIGAGIVLAVLIGLAGWALLTGLRARAGAAASLAENARLAALVASGPAQAMIVRADGRLDLPDRLADWFGLSPPPRFLADLATPVAGLEPDDLAALMHDVTATQRAGRRFARPVHARGSARTLLITGQRAPHGLAAPGAVVLWVFDATASESEIARLGGEAGRLRAAFEALTGLIEVAPMPMWHRDAGLRLTMVNSAYVRAVEGADAADVIARGVELIEATASGGPLASAGAARDAGLAGAVNLPATIGGARRMLRVHDVPMPGGGVAGFAVDIEELERARAATKRFGDAQRDMLDRLSAGVAQFSPDRALIFFNQPFQRLFAMPGEWLADRPEFDRVLERMRDLKRVPEVRDFPGWKAERRDWFMAAEGAIEESWLLPDGTHLRVVAHPLPDGGLLLIFEDRTEQVQLASARDTLLRVRTATFDNLFEALGVFATDGRLQIWNRRFRDVWGFDEAMLLTHPRVDALTAAAGARLANPERAALIGDLVRAATVERQQRGGRVAFADGRHFEFTAVPLPDGNALFTMLDISDSRRMEQVLRDRAEALEAADRIKTAFVASMSDELRTPLTSISGFAEMLEGGYAGKLTRQARDYVAAILDSVERLGTLVDDVLDLTQGDSQRIERADLDLVEVARAAAAAIRPAALAKQLDFAVALDPSLGRVAGDARRLRESIEHLLRHAVAATPAGGRVLLHGDGNRTTARVIVSDDGPGMDRAAAGRAFDQFAGVAIVRGEERALGLGLPLARQFVEAHGGTIALVSEEGEGTLITIEIPR